MKILVACQESQRVANAFRAKGHEAYSCDLLASSGGNPHYHIIADAREVAYGQNWDMMIAFPPCTFLSNVSAPRMRPGGVLNQERYQKALEARQFFMDLYNAPIEYIALENPLPLSMMELPDPTQVIQPWMFGDPYTKRTLLWLKNLPQLQPTNPIDPIGSWVALNRNKKLRSKTFPGVAQAMAEQWSGLQTVQSTIPFFSIDKIEANLSRK